MAGNPFVLGIKPLSVWGEAGHKKKRGLTASQKLWCWEHNSHRCNICGGRVAKQSDAEFDHTRAYSKGGATNLSNVKITHRHCNRLKGKKSLSETKRMLGIKSKSKKRKRKSSKKATNPLFPSLRMPRFRF